MTHTNLKPINEVVNLLKPLLPRMLLSMLSGLAAGAATVSLIALINSMISGSAGMSKDMLSKFLLLALAAVIARYISGIVSNYVGEKLVAGLRLNLVRKILCAPADALEKYQTYRLMPILTNDIGTVAGFTNGLGSLVVAVVVVIGCFFYLATLSLPLFLFFILTLVLGATVQSWAQRKGIARYEEIRTHYEYLHKIYRGIGDGAKELKMQRSRRIQMFDDRMEKMVNEILKFDMSATSIYLVAGGIGSALLYVLIVLVFSWGSWYNMEQEAVVGFILVLLFANGYFMELLGALPGFARAKIAMSRIADLSERFANSEPYLYLDKRATSLEIKHSLEMRDVCYTFPAPELGGSAFQLGPISLRLRAGEMVFVVGDNGSGKTTMIKLLLGLYAPQQGQILLDDVAMTDETRDDYRQLFSTVFSDFYLFEDLSVAGDGSNLIAELPEKALPYLERLEISHKVCVKDGVFSTVDLSTGQRKRLALVHAYLEGRPILVFDEWSADQDPTFRKLFYTELLPELRAKGHLLVVISHDDRYFHLADRVVRLGNGKIVEEFSNPPSDGVTQ